MTQEVLIEMVGSQAQLLQAFVKQQMAMQKSIDKMAKLGDVSKKASDDAAAGLAKQNQGFDRAVGKLTAMASGWMSITSAISFAMAAQAKYQQQTEQAAANLDDLQRKFRVQSGLRGADAAAAQAKVEQIGAASAATNVQSYEAATQLVSSGATVAEVTDGGLLQTLLGGSAALNLAGKNVSYQELAQASLGYLNANGKELTSANLQDALGRLFTLFQGTNLQLSDLGPLSKVAAGLKDKMTSEEQFAATAIFKDVGVSGEESATYLRNITGRLRTAGGDQMKLRALKALGITPDQVDLIGEDFGSVLSLFAERTAGMDVAQRDVAFKQLFDEQGVVGFNLLLESRNKLGKYIGMQQDQSGYQLAIAEGQSGRNPALQRLESSIESQLARRDDGGAITGKALEDVMLQQGYGVLPRYMAWGLYGSSRLVGFSPQDALTLAAPTGKANAYGSGEMIDVEQLVNARVFEVMRKNNELLQENNDLMRQQNQGTTQPRPPAPRPSQALSR